MARSTTQPRRRATIADVASRAGVSTSAVSYALNGKPGVSERTREHVLAIAKELRWVADVAARNLSLSRTDTVGLVVARDARLLASEMFFMEFVAGLQTALARHSQAVLFQLVPDVTTEIATYERWWAEQRVDGVILMDLREGDPRIALVRSLGLPAVVVGDPAMAGGLMCVWTDDATGAREAVRHLHGLGHRAIARITGAPEFALVPIRDAAFVDECSALGIAHLVVTGDFGAPAAARLTAGILSDPTNPYTAIVYDSGLTAVAGLTAAHALGIRVPDDVSIMGWDDSVMCTFTDPAVSVMSHDVVAYGETVGQWFNALLAGESAAPHLHGVPSLTQRGSTSRARHARDA